MKQHRWIANADDVVNVAGFSGHHSFFWVMPASDPNPVIFSFDMQLLRYAVRIPSISFPALESALLRKPRFAVVVCDSDGWVSVLDMDDAGRLLVCARHFCNVQSPDLLSKPPIWVTVDLNSVVE